MQSTETSGKTRKWNRKRQDIMSVAESVFAERGYESTKLEHIAEAMQMQRPSLHYYFKGKEELYDAVFGQIVDDQLQAIKKLRDVPTEELPEKIAVTWIDFAAQRPTAAHLILEQYFNNRLPATPSAIRARRLIFAEISAALERGRANGGAAIDTTFFMLLVSGMTKFWASVQQRMIQRLDYDTLSDENLEQFQRVLAGFVTDLMSGRYTTSTGQADRPAEVSAVTG